MMLDRMLRRRTYHFLIDGYRFQAVVSPLSFSVEWVDCPSVYVPSGYSSTAMLGGGFGPQRLMTRLLAWLRAPLPSEEEIRADIESWLESTLEDAAEDGVDLGR
ncbi:hypothetical protein [Corynebacterium aquilae]|uniref:Uncharacterized protein n=1 Tax=Corynebacterium aquilae DSM 44791 TaxID=1431546 RepID=A0A1L7CEP4_9CORY|nr:hypothetical protein [Corynebacterium aquilae]APT84321.1 hypothetical protein CAQU_03710 [Corynebacterium aquilae DSM 44791]